jgi:hypothetical protein
VCVDGSEDVNCTRTQPPEGSSMGEADGVHKRRMFRWPKEARELVREYKEQTSRSQEHNETGRRMLITKLAAISGNPRDACLRFLRELGVHQKRAYREWTKPEQQRLLDLIITMPVEEAAKILRRPAGSVRSMLHRLGIGGKTGREWFTSFPSPAYCTPAPMKYRSGSTWAGSSRALSLLPERKRTSSIPMISVSS